MALTTTIAAATGHEPNYSPVALSHALRHATKRNRDLEDLVVKGEELVQSLEINLQLHKDISQLQEEQLEARERLIAALKNKVGKSDKVIAAQRVLAKSNKNHIKLLQRLCVANHNYALSLENMISVLHQTHEERVLKLVGRIDALNKEREQQGILAKRRQSLLDNTKAKLRCMQKCAREGRRLQSDIGNRMLGLRTVLRSKNKGGRGTCKDAKKRART